MFYELKLYLSILQVKKWILIKISKVIIHIIIDEYEQSSISLHNQIRIHSR